MKKINTNWHQQTKAIQLQIDSSTDWQQQSSAIFMNSGYRFHSNEQARALFAKEMKGNTYGRYHNPNCFELVDKLCLLEQTEAGLAVSSGMAAIFAIMATFCKAGDHIIIGSCVFGSTVQIVEKFLAKWGISHSTVIDGSSDEVWQETIKPNTKLVFIETPTNPLLALNDIAAIAKICKANNCLLAVDNVCATPIAQNPSVLGADLVMNSTTKYIDGSGRALGGIILGKSDLIKEVEFFVRHTGPSMSGFNAWLFSKSLEHLTIRMQTHANNALTVATELQNHKKISQVRYPHLESHPQYELAKRQMSLGGGLISFRVGTKIEDVSKFIDSLQLFAISANLGDSRSLATHPTFTTHSSLSAEQRKQMGIADNLVRLSIGLEHADDLLGDLLAALDAI